MIHLIFPNVLELHLDNCLPHKHYFFIKLTSTIRRWVPSHPPFKYIKENLNLLFILASQSLGSSIFFFFLIFGQAQPLHTMRGVRTEKGWKSWFTSLEQYLSAAYPHCVSICRTIKSSKKLWAPPYFLHSKPLSSLLLLFKLSGLKEVRQNISSHCLRTGEGFKRCPRDPFVVDWCTPIHHSPALINTVVIYMQVPVQFSFKILWRSF